MIELTTLKGNAFYLNPELIERVEEIHDTIITLSGGKKIRVNESPEVVAQKFMVYKRAIHHGNWEVTE
jgi:flagellar protein FlbD